MATGWRPKHKILPQQGISTKATEYDYMNQECRRCVGDGREGDGNGAPRFLSEVVHIRRAIHHELCLGSSGTKGHK
ncbi:hypothetical protein ACS0TY_022943 [Phlomoides rotata]